MSEPTDQNQSDPMDDKELSVLYARGSTEQPSGDLDQAILGKARMATGQQPAKSKNSSWSQAISMAAVLVVSVTVVMLVRKEAPQPLSDTRQLAMVQEQKAASTPASKPSPKPAKRQMEKQQEAPLAESRVTTMSLQDFMTKKEASQEKAKAQQQTRAKEQAQDKAIAASPALALNKKALTQKAPALKTPAREGLTQESIQVETMAAGATSGSVMGLAQEGKSCNQLTEQDCFNSAACTLTKNKDGQGYQCHPAKDHCELMFRQSEGTKQSCETKAGCVYVPANCYCPPGIECRCSGGEPAQCRSTIQ
jgi:hypothetical protein